MAKKITIHGVRRSEPDMKLFVLALLEIPSESIESTKDKKGFDESPATQTTQGRTETEQ